MSTVKVSHILSVVLQVEEGKKDTLLVKAEGENSNSNMTNVRLDPVVYVRPPADGIWDFHMNGEEPEHVDQIPTRVRAQHNWKIPKDAVGVRVSGAGNSKVALLRRSFGGGSEAPRGIAAQPHQEIEILKALAWVDIMPIQPTPGGTLHVAIEYNCDDHGPHQLQAAQSQGINPAILLLEITHSPEHILFSNPRHNSYVQGLTRPGQYTSIDLLYKGKKVGAIDKIPIVA